MDKRMILFVGLSMSVGWRIRGQFGHEMGAAIAGALGAMAIVLFSAREDWLRRVHYFAFFGALGWSFGGSMSYMKVVGYCHSSDAPTAMYGFAGLFLIGFLWAALGGAGTALPAVLEPERLADLFPPLAAAFAGWLLQDIFADVYRMASGRSLDWLGTDWLAAVTAIVAVLVLAVWRRRLDIGTALVLHLAVGWFAGFLILVIGLGLHLNPPRGDNWAGCIGLFAGLMVFCRRQRLAAVTMTALMTGFLGGSGFVLGQTIKLAFIATGGQWGWHVVMEWLHGLFFGIALAGGMLALVRSGRVLPQLHPPRWTGVFSIFFLLCVVTYMNFRRSPTRWLRFIDTFTEYPYGVAVVSGFVPSRGWIGWFDAVYLVFAAGLLWLMLRHLREPLAFVPPSWLGRAQLLYLVFLWTIAFMSLTHVTPELQPLEWSIQTGIMVHAIACTVLMLASARQPRREQLHGAAPVYHWSLRKTIAAGLAASMSMISLGWGVKRALFGDAFAPSFYTNHIRFGPNNTNDRP